MDFLCLNLKQFENSQEIENVFHTILQRDLKSYFTNTIIESSINMIQTDYIANYMPNNYEVIKKIKSDNKISLHFIKQTFIHYFKDFSKKDTFNTPEDINILTWHLLKQIEKNADPAACTLLVLSHFPMFMTDFIDKIKERSFIKKLSSYQRQYNLYDMSVFEYTISPSLLPYTNLVTISHNHILSNSNITFPFKYLVDLTSCCHNRYNIWLYSRRLLSSTKNLRDEDKRLAAMYSTLFKEDEDYDKMIKISSELKYNIFEFERMMFSKIELQLHILWLINQEKKLVVDDYCPMYNPKYLRSILSAISLLDSYEYALDIRSRALFYCKKYIIWYSFLTSSRDTDIQKHINRSFFKII